MKTIFRPNINSKKKKKNLVLSGALVALILIAVIFQNFSYRIVSRPVFYVLGPFFKMKNNFDKWWGDFRLSFNVKKSLQDENKMLHEKIMQMEVKTTLSEIIEKENKMLKSAFLAEERKNFLMASVISRPPETPYDMLIIDAGSSLGAKEGMQVSAFGNVLLGYVADVFNDASKIKMISAFGEETNVILESSQTPAIAIGRGGENFEITLPRAVKVDIGERVITWGRQLMIVGFVEKIEQETANPFQKITFRLPVNIQYLNQVFLLKK
jgi:cell shape-determining protein MreC